MDPLTSSWDCLVLWRYPRPGGSCCRPRGRSRGTRSPDLATGNFRTIVGSSGVCRNVTSASCRHETFVAGILAARRGARAPAIAPDCTLLVRPVFSEAAPVGQLPHATPGDLVEAMVEAVSATVLMESAGAD
jgi:hypothetical protein